MAGAYSATVDHVDAVLATFVGIAREQVAVPVGELEALVAARLGLDPQDPATGVLIGDVERDLLDDPGSPVTMLPPDVVVHVPAITDGIVLTHRLSAAEHAEAYLDIDTDLAGFLRVSEPCIPGGPLDPDDDGAGAISWTGPIDWLSDLPLDALLAVRVTGDGQVTVSVLDTEPVAPPGLVVALRAAYDLEVADPWLPVPAEQLVLGMLHADRAVFAEPRPPLAELAAAAGLERRAHEFAHAESVWKSATESDRHFRLMDQLGTGEDSRAAMEAFDLLTEQAGDPAALRRALDHLSQPDVLVAVTEELLGPEDDPERVTALGALADRLLAVAGRSPRAAVAGWIAALAAERGGRVLDAESHLRAAALAADGWPLVEDRLAWYESDRGDAPAALGRWQSIEVPDDDPDVAVIRPFAVSGPEPGRNEPCWCGSGRKFKQCHLGRPAAAPLPDRVIWLYRKAIAYTERRGGAAETTMLWHAETLAGDDADLADGEDLNGDALDRADLDRALADPLTVDTVLHEGGWFERFLADRGPLLPADEALLAVSWLLVDRTVYEVREVRPGAGLTVRDLRTGDRVDVTERTASGSVAVGGLVCARAVPDGAGHQFVGAVFAVPPGRERELLEVLDDGDEFELLEWMVATTAQPVIPVVVEEVPRVSPAVEHLRNLRERRWCDEPVVALDGLTPREAAADPTRRGDLGRLVDSFPEIDPVTGAFGLRSAQLRTLLAME